MRQFEKRLDLASKYKEWLDKQLEENKQHPKYTSSAFKYYYDIVANLIWAQQGLCAYSEKRLQDHRPFQAENWTNGTFKKFDFAGQLDHFDPSKKKEYGWDWENFFLIDSDVNVKAKHQKQLSGLLKPDLAGYSPELYLEYKLPEHIFVPNRNLDPNDQEKVRKDISALGLNFQPIIDIRKDYLSPVLIDLEYSGKTIEEIRTDLKQFYTAFDLVISTWE
jgi:hypothetical protein